MPERNLEKSGEREITKKEMLLVDFYVETGMKSWEKAAILAGYAKSTASAKAPTWVGKSRKESKRPWMWDYLQKRINRVQAKIENKTQQIIEELCYLSFYDPAEIFTSTNKIKNIHDIPIEIRKAITSISYNDKGEIRQIKLANKEKALELLGRYFQLWQGDINQINQNNTQNNYLIINTYKDPELEEFLRKRLQGARQENSKKPA